MQIYKFYFIMPKNIAHPTAPLLPARLATDQFFSAALKYY